MKFYSFFLLFLLVCVVAAQSNLLPEIRFTSNVPEEISFAVTTKNDIVRPEVKGTYTITNCDENLKITNQTGTMKVRGNQTAGWAKKGFALKFDSAINLLGLNNGNKFKKWVLMADAKDTSLIRTALGLYLSKAVCKEDENVWVSDYLPVNVYLNDEYWGYYYLAEQKEVKEGRIHLPETPEGYNDSDIGYCFELDYYAKDEAKKPDGDPTFTVTYKPKDIFYKIEKSLANFGVTKTYTMLSEITNPDTQITFIKNKVEDLYTILYEAAINGTAKTFIDGKLVETNESIEKVINDNFDINSFVDGYIINEYDCAPDVGYSSFYMSFDNSPNGDKKLRFDNPWDFDSNFGNRRNFIPDADDLYMRRTSNMWLQLFARLDFFMDKVREKWNKLRDDKVFDDMIQMMKTYFNDYDEDFKKNFERWPTNDANFEVREPFQSPKNYLEAEKETINWCTKRFNYLDMQWGGDEPLDHWAEQQPIDLWEDQQKSSGQGGFPGGVGFLGGQGGFPGGGQWPGIQPGGQQPGSGFPGGQWPGWNPTPTTTTTTTTKASATPTSAKINEINDCWSTALNYPCCNKEKPEVIFTDDDGDWSVENGNWCGIKKVKECWALSLGYKCCSSCLSVITTDNSGKWSVENNEWCGLEVSCN